MVVTISNLGYIKRTAASEFRTQSRGGRGAKGSRTRDEDFIVNMFVANSHNYLLLFTESGKCFWLRVFEIPEASKSSAGRAIQNILNIAQDDKVKAYINIPNLNGFFPIMGPSLGSTGGSNAITLGQLPSHTHGASNLSIGNHTHSLNFWG